MFLKKYYKPILRSYIFFISSLSIYYLAGVNSVSTYNAMTEWVINYQGGFVRRGLIGEIIFQISNLFELNLRFCFFILQSFLYIVFYYLIYDLLKHIKPNYFILLAIFSPIFIIFPLAELEAIGRKEVLIFISLLISLKLYFKHLNNNFIVLFISTVFPVLILTFEASIFYSFFFISLIFIYQSKIDSIYFFKLFLFSLPSLICIYVIYFFPHSLEETAEMCEKLKNIGEECGLAAAFISNTIDYHMAEVGWKIQHVIRYTFIFVFGFFSLIYLSCKSKFNPQKINSIFCKFPFVLHLLILILPTMIMFIIAVDTGRWTHMTYTCSFIYYFGLLKNNAIFFDGKLFSFNFEKQKLKNFIKIIIFIIICLSWNPKAVYHEDLGSFPIYRAIEKMPNFYNNIFKIEILR